MRILLSRGIKFNNHGSFLCSVDRVSLCNLVNKANLVHSFSWYVYFFSLHVAGDHVPIIRRNTCVYATLGTCYSVCKTVWYAGWNKIQLFLLMMGTYSPEKCRKKK